MALDAQILLSILAHETSSGDISRTLRATPASYSLILGNGTGANQAQVVWSDARTATTTPGSLDLASLTDDRGTVSFTAIKAMYLRNSGSVTLNWNGGSWVNGPLSSPGDCVLFIPAGGCAVFVAPTAGGYAVAGSPQTMAFDTPSGSTTYEIVLIGEGTVT